MDADYYHDAAREEAALSLYVNVVELQTPPGKKVAIPVKQIMKIQEYHHPRKPRRDSEPHFYRLWTLDGHLTTVKSKYGWRDFIDYVFDPYGLRERRGPKVGRKDELLDDDTDDEERDLVYYDDLDKGEAVNAAH